MNSYGDLLFWLEDVAPSERDVLVAQAKRVLVRTKTDSSPGTRWHRLLTDSKITLWGNPSLVAVLPDVSHGAFRRSSVLIICGNAPNRGVLFVQSRKWGSLGFPGGYSDKHETPAETALREVREETGIEIAAHALHEVSSSRSRRPFAGFRWPTITTHFLHRRSGDVTRLTRTPRDDPEVSFVVLVPERMVKSTPRIGKECLQRVCAALGPPAAKS